jgi:hypothetical protein
VEALHLVNEAFDISNCSIDLHRLLSVDSVASRDVSELRFFALFFSRQPSIWHVLMG